MAKPETKRKPPPHAWKPGISANPAGRPPMSPELKLVRNLTQEQLARIGKLMLEKNYDELELISNSPQSNGLLALVAGSLCRAIRTQDWEKVETLMSRIIGKPKENLDVTLKGAESFAQLMAMAAGKKFGNETKGG